MQEFPLFFKIRQLLKFPRDLEKTEASRQYQLGRTQGERGGEGKKSAKEKTFRYPPLLTPIGQATHLFRVLDNFQSMSFGVQIMIS